jgi:hypothetical protein
MKLLCFEEFFIDIIVLNETRFFEKDRYHYR